MRSSFKLVSKFVGNEVGIFIVLPTGERKQILHCICPNDLQLAENCKLADEMEKLLAKRIRSSVR